jgi:hypothetical protein
MLANDGYLALEDQFCDSYVLILTGSFDTADQLGQCSHKRCYLLPSVVLSKLKVRFYSAAVLQQSGDDELLLLIKVIKFARHWHGFTIIFSLKRNQTPIRFVKAVVNYLPERGQESSF